MPDTLAAPTVLIVSASMGAGHDAVSRELARRLSDAGARARVVDLLDLTGAPGRRLRRTYRALLDHAPWLYGAAMATWARWPTPFEALTAAGAVPFEAALDTAVADVRPDVVVSTYNLAGQCLGRLVRRRELDVAVVTLMIDPGAHPYWVSPDVDLHLVPSSLTAAEMARYGARGVVVTAPLVRPEFHTPLSRAEARSRMHLPASSRIALFSAGSWAVGGLERSLAAAAGIDDLTSVVLCGHDERVRRRLAGRPRTCAVGWTTDMAGYLSAADVVVDNAGGLTCWEAQACGTPVVLFRPLPGHGRANARTLDRLGWARYARSDLELRSTLREPSVAAASTTGPFDGADAVAQIIGLIRSGPALPLAPDGHEHVRP